MRILKMEKSKSESCGTIIIIIIALTFTLLQHISALNASQEKCFLQDSYCLKEKAQASLCNFIGGKPEFGIKSYDKMKLHYVEVRENDVHYVMWNITVEGFNNTVFDEVSVNLAFNILRISFQVNLVATFDYEANGKVFGVPINGHGKGVIVMKNLQVEIIIPFEIEKNEEGKDVMHLKSYFFGADAIDGVYYFLEDLFNGDKVKNEMALQLLNKSWRTLVANYGRFFTTEVIDDIFKSIKIYMRSWPLEELAIY